MSSLQSGAMCRNVAIAAKELQGNSFWTGLDVCVLGQLSKAATGRLCVGWLRLYDGSFF